MNDFTNMDSAVASGTGFEGSMVGEYYLAYLDSQQASSVPFLGRIIEPVSDVALYRLLQSGSTSYVVTQNQLPLKVDSTGSIPQWVHLLDPHYFELVVTDAQHNLRLYHLKQPLPRAYLARDWKTFPTRAKLLDYMKNADSTGYDPARETLLEKNVSPLPIAAKSPFRLIKMDEPAPEQINMNVSTPTTGLLVLQDQYYPGWVVTIDGKRAELLRCNGFMRAVFVPPGTHSISFLFQPYSLMLGFVFSVIGVCLCTLLVVRDRFLSRRSPQLPGTLSPGGYE